MRLSILALAFGLLSTPALAQVTPEAVIQAAANAALEQVPPDDPDAPRHTKRQAYGFWAYGLVQMVDIGQSMYLFGERKGIESNPVLARYQDRPEAFAVVKWSIAGAGAFAAWNQFHRGHRKAGWTILIGGIAANALVIANNHKILRPSGR